MVLEGTICETQVQQVGDVDQILSSFEEILLSTRVHSRTDIKEKALPDTYDQVVEKLAFKMGEKSKMKKAPVYPSPMKLISLISAALVCGFAVEFGVDQGRTHNTCSAIVSERRELAETVDSMSEEMNDRMVAMTSLLAKETEENNKLKEELEHTKRMLKFFQGTTEAPRHLDTRNEEAPRYDEHASASHRHWVQGALDDGLFKVWQVRYLLSEGIRYVRMSLPQGYQITQRLHEWEDIVAGPVE